ncbi:MAG TPA: hypothetical protein VE219_02415 [Candidatus Sulfotelmatobacter sp.]|nr:hypothetical protein [Candidatus Sulfotelmatobacter sp.]
MLPLPVTAALSAPRVTPEMAVPCSEPFDSDLWHFSVDWDGSRALLFSDGRGHVTLQDERLRDISEIFPELTASSAGGGHRSLVLDGTLVILGRDGRPELTPLVTRLRAARGANTPRDPFARLAVFLASDLLYLDGEPVMRWPLERRLGTLSEVVPGDGRIQVPENVAGLGCGLAAASAECGLSALLARRRDSPYCPGVAAPHRLRVPLEDRANAIVVGLARRRGEPTSTLLLLAEQSRGKLVFAGAAPASRDGWGRTGVDESVPSGPSGVIQSMPARLLSEITGIRWVASDLVATVRHRGRTEAGTLVNPTVLVLRDDIDPLWCVRRDPVAPPAAVHVGSGFRPTVIVNLPLAD